MGVVPDGQARRVADAGHRMGSHLGSVPGDQGFEKRLDLVEAAAVVMEERGVAVC